MPSASDCINRLVVLDAVLVNQYATATAAQRTVINRCRSAIETTLHEIIRQDMQQRTGDIISLTASLKGANRTLQELVRTAQQASTLLKTAAAVVAAAQAVAAII